ncbi:GNAT family N-acetyltransferase [Zavarzinia compransoris]|uniref:GNAT family N-acetyltransferase n=1 Tax=Zavarzinia compransoris TaxID=1264899 RepID=A0A317DWE3_9PROT|nr:GNAT family N-acetyltransferase [Zavarzinia compransoris]PWR18851.1 GNAT family N-acetyltransferase [Zavarzinia compransoris]TDP48843.1 phosphinothricin acetyltransferase [Zavarzinia compransoris]
MTGWRLVPAGPDHLPGITAIYRHHVAEGFASFEEVPPDPAEMGRRQQALLAGGYPYLVALDENEAVLGYAYAGPYRPRSAYRFTVEDSIYLDPGAAGRGIGRVLLAQLIEACRARGYRQIVAVIGDSGNAASIGLHRALGFEPAGVLRAVGLKKGRWLDSVLMQLGL